MSLGANSVLRGDRCGESSPAPKGQGLTGGHRPALGQGKLAPKWQIHTGHWCPGSVGSTAGGSYPSYGLGRGRTGGETRAVSKDCTLRKLPSGRSCGHTLVPRASLILCFPPSFPGLPSLSPLFPAAHPPSSGLLCLLPTFCPSASSLPASPPRSI